MLSPRRLIVCPIVIAASLLAAGMAVAQTQPAADRVPLSERDVIAQLVAFNERFVIDGYRTAGRRDARWDVDAIAFLAAQARDGVSDGSDVFYRDDARMPIPDRLTLGRRARDAGCDDPLVLYHLGIALDNNGDAPEAAKTYEAANVSAEKGAACPAVYRMMLLIADWRANKRDNSDERRQKFNALLRATLTDRATLPDYRRAVWNTGALVFLDDDQARMIRMGDAIEDLKDADPWLYGTFMGRVEIQRAWKARGSGSAGTVTDKGWKEFARHLSLARGHFERAITADDVHPQPFAQMITVAMAESSGLERAWFEHAIARQCDLPVAFTNYRYSLWPRWGGSHEKMLALGIESVDGGRFDTRVPATLLGAISGIEADQQHPLDARQQARVYPEVVRCLDGYLANNARPAVQLWARSSRAAWAARLEKWDEAQAQFVALREAKMTPRADVFTELGLDAARAAAQAALFTGPLAAEARAAVADFRKLDPLIAQLDPADPAVDWLRDRRATADLRAQLSLGDWIPVPLELAENWRVEAGEWSIDGDAIVGKPTDKQLLLVSRFELPERYEVRLTATGEGNGGQANVGIGWAPNLPVIAMIYQSADVGYLTRYYSYGTFPMRRDAKGTISLHARVDGGKVSILDANGIAVASHDFGSLPAGRLSLGLTPQEPSDATWRFASLEIRKLN